MSQLQNKIIRMLRSEKKWAVIPISANDLKLSRLIGGRAVSVILEYAGQGKYNLKPATYQFKSSCSHFDYSEKEDRFSRNKNVFKSLMKTLRESAIAGYIANLDTFLVVNKANRKSNKKNLAIELKKLTK